ENNKDTFIEGCKKIRSKSTKDSYKTHLKTYFKAINKSPEGYINVDIRKMENGERIDLLDKYQNDVKIFAESINNRPPKSQVVMISVVKKFLSYFYIDLPQRFWDEISVSSVPITEKKTPDARQLKLILDRGDIKHKALFSLVATSGMRIRESLSLTLNDVDMENRIIRLKDTKTKSKYSRTTFFTDESKELLLRWLELRDKYIENKKVKSKYVREQMEKKGKYVEDRIFPIEYNTAYEMWNNLLEKAGKKIFQNQIKNIWNCRTLY
ncbi:MAG: tyrosine-type recombinase/integrase, partial [Promethearchaeota archaeon]